MHQFPTPCSPRSAAACDIRVRLIVSLAAIVAVVVSTRIGFGLIALGCSLVGLAAAGVRAGTLARRFMGPLAIAILVLLARTFLTGAAPLGSVHLGFFRLTPTRDGLWAGALIASRILGSMGVVMLLSHDMPATETFAALHWSKVPRIWIEIAVLMYRYLHLFFEQAVSVVSAQKVRLGYGSMRRSFQSMGNLAGIVLLRSLDQAEKSHEAMTARGYRGRVPLPVLPSLPGRQWAFASLGVGLIAAACFLAERWPL